VSKVRFLALGEAHTREAEGGASKGVCDVRTARDSARFKIKSRAKESATCAQRAKRAIKIGILTLCATVCGCTQANLTNGKSTASYKGVKIFSPTVLSLRSGNCAVPGVDAAGIVTEPPTPPLSDKAAPAPDCSTAVMTVNGVDLKGLLNFVETAILGGIAAG